MSALSQRDQLKDAQKNTMQRLFNTGKKHTIIPHQCCSICINSQHAMHTPIGRPLHAHSNSPHALITKIHHFTPYSCRGLDKVSVF